MSGTPSPIGFLLKLFAEHETQIAAVLDNKTSTYGEILTLINGWKDKLKAAGVEPGSVALLKADYSADGISCFLALLDLRAIVIPVASASAEKAPEFADLGEAEFIIDLLKGNDVTKTETTAAHDLYKQLRDAGSPGIVLFSSGTTGASKGAVHSADRLLTKFHAPRRDLKTIAFLLFDHIGGLDTLFYCLSNCSTLVFTSERDPETVCRLIEEHGIEVLPTAPSFLNMMLISGAHERHDLSSLKIITYGAEMMPQHVLERCADIFPNAVLMQKYGATEFGAMRSQSRDNRSRWVRLGGEGYDCRIRNGKLEVKSASAMLGYLNAPSPLTEDGYFQTGDCVETDGEYFRFLGRDSDIINVGGQKVYPAEVESLIREMPEVADVSVYGVPHAMLGKAVCCKLQPSSSEYSAPSLRTAIRKHLSGKLEAYKIPQKYVVTDKSLTTDRFKKIRSGLND